MAPTSAPKDKRPGTRTDASEDGTGAFVVPGQAVLVSECLWNRRPYCYGTADCCLIDPDDWDDSDDPF